MVSPLIDLGHYLASAAVPANPKIGVIDIDQTLSQTPAGKRANDAFEKTRKQKQADLDKKQEELKKEDADLQKQSTVLKAEGSSRISARRCRRSSSTCSRTYVKLERDLAQERTKLIQIAEAGRALVKEIAKAEGARSSSSRPPWCGRIPRST
jgi:Skp family chaperone for outer membrane proteins